MLIIGLCTMVWGLLELIPFSLPSFTEDFESLIAPVADFINQALAFIYEYIIDYNVMKTIFVILVSWVGIKYGYKFIMWIIRKLPIGVQD